MSPDRARQALAEATVRAARRMGLSRLFLQVVAQELPDDAVAGLRIEPDRDGAVVARAAHACDPGCDGSAHHCVTALKVQALVGRQRKSPFEVADLAREGDAIRVRLVPVPS